LCIAVIRKVLEYTSLKNIIAFLFGIFILVATLWQKRGLRILKAREGLEPNSQIEFYAYEHVNSSLKSHEESLLRGQLKHRPQ